MDLSHVDHEEVVLASTPLVTPSSPSPRVDSGHPCSVALADNADLSSALHRDPSLHRSALACLLSSKATGTFSSYTRTLRRFEEFCIANKLSYPHFSSDAALQFILHLDNTTVSYNFLATVKPALTLLEQSLGSPTAFTPSLNLFLDGARRRAAARRPPRRKAAALSSSDITAILDKFYLPLADTPHLLHLVQFRTIFRLVFIYHTACRFDCFRRLRACHLELVGPNIFVNFPSAKNDQLHHGSRSAIVASPSPYCPVRLFKAFFSRLGFSFGAAAADRSFLNFQTRRNAAVLLPITTRSLSYSEATKNLRDLLAAVGITSEATDKSLKMLAVTSAFAAGASCDDVMHLGRWRTPHMPLHYKHNSDEFKQSISAVVPVLAPPPQ